jgi:hypothetical protein
VFYSALLLNFTVGTFYYPPPLPVIYNPGPVYELSSLIDAVILILMLINLIIYLEIRATLKALR